MSRLRLLLILMAFSSLLWSVETASSLPFSDSFLLRAYGSEALYWNPAAINQSFQDVILPGMNLRFSADNNSFDLDTYNYISGRYLTESDKTKILTQVDEKMKATTNSNVMLLGLTLGKVAFASSIHARGDITLSEDYLKLLLFGNEEQDYVFSQNENQFNALSYQDVTIGFGDSHIDPIIANIEIPTITVGASFSALLGYGIAETEKYMGSLHSGLDGLSVTQDIYLKTGIGGLGTKAMVGLFTKPVSNLTLGMSLDNLLGQIIWMGKTDLYHYTITSDSTYVSNLEEDIFTYKKSSQHINNFTTKLPAELRLGALYGLKNINLSIDWVQGFGKSQITSSIGNFSVAAEYTPFKWLSLQTGTKLGNEDIPGSYSYGIGFNSGKVDGSIGCQSFESLLPGYKSKGIAFSSNFKIHY